MLRRIVKIFVIHARRTGYGVIRALKDFTRDIYIADNEVTPVFHSRYVKRAFVVSDITKVSNDEFLSELIALARTMGSQEERPIVFTGKDDYLQFFCQNSEALSPYYLLSFESDWTILQKALSKKELVDLAARAHVTIPLSFTDDDPIGTILSTMRFPAIVKPAMKATPERDMLSEAFRLKVCESSADLEQAVSQLRGLGVSYVVQEYIPGGDSELYTMGIYSYRGTIKAWSASKKLRQFPPGAGECTYGKTVYDCSMLKATERLIAEAGLTGISQVEFKRYREENYLIEINPRVWSWHQIHSEVGVNLAKIACDHALGETTSEVVHPKRGEKYWMFLMMDILHNRILHRNISSIDLVRSLIGCSLEAFFCLKDPMPFIVHFLRTVRYIRLTVRQSRQCAQAVS